MEPREARERGSQWPAARPLPVPPEIAELPRPTAATRSPQPGAPAGQGGGKPPEGRISSGVRGWAHSEEAGPLPQPGKRRTDHRGGHTATRARSLKPGTAGGPRGGGQQESTQSAGRRRQAPHEGQGDGAAKTPPPIGRRTPRRLHSENTGSDCEDSAIESAQAGPGLRQTVILAAAVRSHGDCHSEARRSSFQQGDVGRAVRDSAVSWKTDSPARRQEAPIRSIPEAAPSCDSQTRRKRRVVGKGGGAADPGGFIQVAKNTREHPAIPAPLVDHESRGPCHSHRQ